MAEIAIIHFVNYARGQNRASMKTAMEYTKQDFKTRWQGQSLVSGINCRPESVYDDFLSTKLLYHKDDKTMFYHMVQSHPKDAEVNPVTAHAAAVKLAEYFAGREVLVCTHVDRDHIHSHFIINSVSLEDGRKLHIAEPQLRELRQRNDKICAEFGLPVFQKGQKKKVKSMSTAEYHTAAKGESWKFRLMNTIDECMRFAHTREEFLMLMRSEGYEVRWEKTRAGITYTIPSGMKCRDDRLHDEKYLKEAMEREFRIRQTIFDGGTETAEPAAEQQYRSAGTTGTTPAESASRNAPDLGGMERVGGAADSHGAPTGGADSRFAGVGTADEHSPDLGANNGADAGCGGSAGEPAADGNSNDTTGWEEERAFCFSQKPVSAPADLSPGNAAPSPNRGGVLGAVAQLGRTAERAERPVPVSDTTTQGQHIDSKRLRELREKKIAAGHAAGDHEEEQNFEMTM